MGYDVSFPAQFVPGDFRSEQLPAARNVGQTDTMHFPTDSGLHASRKYTRVDGRKCSMKISGIPDTIGSTSRKHGKEYINPDSLLPPGNHPHSQVSPSKRTLFYFPNNSPLKSNFANTPGSPTLPSSLRFPSNAACATETERKRRGFASLGKGTIPWA